MSQARRISRSLIAAIGFLSVFVHAAVVPQRPSTKPYFLSRDNWERRKPSEIGIDNAAVQAAVDWAKTQGSTWPKDFSNQLRVFGRQLGPMPAEHGDPNWNNRQVLSASWVKQATARGPGVVDYGLLWWLNTDTWSEVSKASYGAQGAGNNTIWIDPEHDLVIVWRWHAGNQSEFFKRIIASIRP